MTIRATLLLPAAALASITYGSIATVTRHIHVQSEVIERLKPLADRAATRDRLVGFGIPTGGLLDLSGQPPSSSNIGSLDGVWILDLARCVGCLDYVRSVQDGLLERDAALILARTSVSEAVELVREAGVRGFQIYVDGDASIADSLGVDFGSVQLLLDAGVIQDVDVRTHPAACTRNFLSDHLSREGS